MCSQIQGGLICCMAVHISGAGWGAAGMGSGCSASSHYIYHCHSWGVGNTDGEIDVGVRSEVS